MSTSGEVGLVFGLLTGGISDLILLISLIHFFTLPKPQRKVSDLSGELKALPILWAGGGGVDWFTGSVLKALPDQATLLFWYGAGLLFSLIPVLVAMIVILLITAIDIIKRMV